MIKNRRMKTIRVFTLTLAALMFGMAGHPTVASAAEPPEALVEQYTGMLDRLRAELTAQAAKFDLEKAKTPGSAEEKKLIEFLSSGKLDKKLVQFVVLHDATPKGLAAFEGQGKEQAALIKQLLADDELMKEMVVADGAAAVGRGGPAAYGEAMLVYTRIQKASEKAKDGVLQRLALAGALKHAGGRAGAIARLKAAAKNKARKEAEEKAKEQAKEAGEDTKWRRYFDLLMKELPEVTVPEAAIAEAIEKHYQHVVQHYMQYEKAYLARELDPRLGTFTVWDLGFLFNFGDPPGHLEWTREMIRTLRPDLVYGVADGMRYSAITSFCVKYGSGHVCLDRGEQFAAQNIIMNGGVCGRRAGMGRVSCRSYGIPAIHRPSPRHGALVRWSQHGWMPNLGPGWGAGYVWGGKCTWFREYTQARDDSEAFLQVKRAHWFAMALEEKGRWTTYHKDPPEGWYGAALRRLRAIVEANKDAPKKRKQDYSDIDEAIGPTLAQLAADREITPADREITYGEDGTILIPAAACHPRDATTCVTAMKSIDSGLQIFMGRHSAAGGGRTIVRGGAHNQGSEFCKSGWRMKDGNKAYMSHSYGNWGLRAAMSPQADQAGPELTLELGESLKLEMVYIKPGTFVMGGENTWDNRFGCYELPEHEVTITKGFYLGKYEVTQAQYDAMMGPNTAKEPRGPNYPATCPGGITATKAKAFCQKVADMTGRDVRLPTEAEWEYACRAGTTTKWFCGDDPSKLADYAWFKDKDDKDNDGKLHPVGQKKPNPWGLYDMAGSVFERVADIYSKDYYANSPKEDPTGPATFDGGGTRFRYTVNVPEAGKYTLSVRMVTVNYNQNFEISVNGAESKTKIMGPYTAGKWQDTEPVTIALKKGQNALMFNRSNPKEAQEHPNGGAKTLHFQRSIALKSVTLKPVK